MSYRDTKEDNYKQRILGNAEESEMQNATEREYLRKYKKTLSKLQCEYKELSKIRCRISKLFSTSDTTSTSEIEELKESARDIETLISHYEQYLLKLERTPPLMYVIERKSVDAYLRENENEAQELIRQYDKMDQKPSSAKKITRAHTMPLSKRIASIISLLLCATLYLLFLTIAFTDVRITYICYTTATGECYHSATCPYIINSAYETTVYQASKKYRPCSRCNPCIEQYETLLTERNYIIPLLISAPTSTTVFFLLTYKKYET